MYFAYIKACIKLSHWNMSNTILIKHIIFVILAINYNFTLMFNKKITAIDALRYIMIQ